MYHPDKKRGFTLIELLVVIAIIGVLTSVVLASLNTASSKGRDANRLAQIGQIQKALQLYFTDNGVFPISSWTCSGNPSGAIPWQTSALATGLSKYMPTLPVDPVNNATYSYLSGLDYCYYATGYGGSGDWYMLVFRLENRNLNFDSTHSSIDCATPTPNNRNYGGVDGYIMTTGVNCTIGN